MLKFIAILLLLNIQMYHAQSCAIQQTSDSTSTGTATDPESSSASGNFNSASDSPSTASNNMVTQAPLAVGLIDSRIWNIFDLGVLNKFVTTSTASPSLLHYLPAATDQDEEVEAKTVKITFAGRTNFRVRHNCPCVLHGRCARNDLCDRNKKAAIKVGK